MAPLLRFKLPKKREPKQLNITDMYSVITEATESTPKQGVRRESSEECGGILD